MDYTAVILAAGKGVRMRSSLPKVVHQTAGKALVQHVVDAVKANGIDDIVVVVGHGREKVEEILAPQGIKFAVQAQQLGTGHALLQTEEFFSQGGHMIVLAGDTPLLCAETIAAILERHKESGAQATVLTCTVNNPTGYGRILRSEQGAFRAVVEEKDATDVQKQIKEINSGLYCFNASQVFRALHELRADNAQGEYYLPDVLDIMMQKDQKIEIVLHEAEEDIYGVNDRVQLAYTEKILRRRKNETLMRSGVTIVDPDTTFIDTQVQIGADTVILPFSVISGNTVIGTQCEIGPGTRITDAIIGNSNVIEYARIKEARVGNNCTIGPYSYLRPETELHDYVKIGDFVEVKKSVIGENSKVPHLSYVGDAIIGASANIGAGTITCNYDGKNKYVTIIEDGAFIGSNTNLIAPVTIGKNAITGAGSSISRDVPPDSLAVERAQAKVIKKRSE